MPHKNESSPTKTEPKIHILRSFQKYILTPYGNEIIAPEFEFIVEHFSRYDTHHIHKLQLTLKKAVILIHANF